MAKVSDKSTTEKNFDEKAQEAKDNFLADFNEIIEGAERLLKETADSASDKASELREHLSERIEEVRNKMSAQAKPICKKGKAAIEATDEYVKENPWKSVGIAVAAGALIALIIRRH